MSINISQMNEQEKLNWLKRYEKQNPTKYLRKFGKIVSRDGLGQPDNWEYVFPEEAIKTIKPSHSFSSVLGVKIDVQEKDKIVVEHKFVEPPAPEPALQVNEPVLEKPKRGRKAKNV